VTVLIEHGVLGHSVGVVPTRTEGVWGCGIHGVGGRGGAKFQIEAGTRSKKGSNSSAPPKRKKRRWVIVTAAG